ncbi:hypothetical protein D9M72_475460 [compost metagenome]
MNGLHRNVDGTPEYSATIAESRRPVTTSFSSSSVLATWSLIFKPGKSFLRAMIAFGRRERALERTEPMVNVPPTDFPEIASTISSAERTRPCAASSI